MEAPNTLEGLFRFNNLTPGEWQIVEMGSGQLSERVFVPPGGEPSRVRVDVRPRFEVEGRVVGAVGDLLSLARVEVIAEGVVGFWSMMNPNREFLPDEILPPGHWTWVHSETGVFKITLPSGIPVTLCAWHPWLRPAAEGGCVTVVGPTSEIVLRLEEGPTCSFKVDSDDPRRGWRDKVYAYGRVALYTGNGGGPPVLQTTAALWGDARVQFGGYEPGTYTLWIDPGKLFAPLLMRGVELGLGATDLGTIEVSRGSSLEVRVTLSPGHDPRALFFRARRESWPAYQREASFSSGSDGILRGLGAGSWNVSVMPSHDITRPMHETLVEVDGVHDQVLDVDLR
jgi:hypothetical protein